MQMMKMFEKRWHKSKKFLLVLLLMASLVSFVICALKWQFDIGWPLATVFCVIVFTMGFVILVAIGKQAAADEYVRGVALTGGIPFEMMKKLKKSVTFSKEETDDASG